MKSILLVIPLVVGVFGATIQDEKSIPAVVLTEEVVTESVTSTSVPSVETRDGEFIIRYPTTPYPDESGTPTEPPPADIDEPTRARMTDQPVITGSADCDCGRPKTRIVGGENATINELPWTVALMRKKDDGTIRGPYCGGTLICDRYVATASHCVDGFEADGIQVWLSEENFLSDDENSFPTVKVDVEKITMHPEYDSKKIDNDIALLKLAEPVTITGGNEGLTPACVPASNENTYEGEDAIVAGWGATEMGGNVSPNLQKVEVPIITNKQCNWRTLYLGKITENMLCAGDKNGGKDSCQGDSGGPLVVKRNNRFLLAGIVSFGYGCAQPLAPGVYARVGRYPEFIQENTQDCQFCSR